MQAPATLGERGKGTMQLPLQRARSAGCRSYNLTSHCCDVCRDAATSHASDLVGSTGPVLSAVAKYVAAMLVPLRS
eukprot:363132-Chlamydomonas_euryale.AAC.17